MTGISSRELAIAAAIGLAALAALVPLSEVFVEAAWIRPTVVTTVTALVLAAAARATGLGASSSLLVSVVGLLVVQTGLHLPDSSLVPWTDELAALRDLGRRGLVSMRDEAAPTEALPGLVLLVSTGAWTVTFVAHELAVRLRGAGVALVPIATLWVVPLAVPQAVPPSRLLAVPFIVAAALVLLVDSDADLVGWARDRVGPRVTLPGVGIATGAIALGLVAPWLLPGLGAPAVLEVGTGRDPSGYQPIVDIGDRLTLPVDRPVLRVRAERRTYLRLAALDTYDDNTWRIGPPGAGSFTPEQAELFPTSDDLPFEVAIADGTTTVVDVEVLDLENIYVPTPYQPVRVTGPGADDMVWSRVGGFLATGELSDNELGGTLRQGVVPGFEYQVLATVPTPSITDLRTVDTPTNTVEPWLRLPGNPDRWLQYAELADDVWADTDATTTVDRVLALQDWFTDDGGFEYSLSDIDPLRGSNALEQFVFGTRTGYCEYFSTAMAVMLRAAGIPARTAVGFLPGELVATAPDGAEDQRDTYQVSTSDAHAWVEVLFPGYGWITFDPTPRSDGSTLPPDEDNLSPEVPVAERTDEDSSSDDPDAADAQADEAVPDAPDIPELGDQPDGTPLPGTADPAAAGQTGDRTRAWVLVLGAVVVAAGALLLMRRARTGEMARAHGRQAALAAQRRVLREGERLGAGRSDAETAIEVLHRWASEGRVGSVRAAELAGLGQRAAFGPPRAAVDGRRATELADQLVDELRAAASRRTRVLAPVRVPVARGVDSARRIIETGRERLTP